MSALLNATPIGVNGVVTLNGQIAAPLTYTNGLPYDGGFLAIDTIGVVSYYNMGLPYTAVGRLATTVASPTSYGSGAAPFNAGRLCMATGVANHYSSGVPYLSAGQVQIVAGAAFSPLELFANGEKGAWYDPSDLSTMFQDSAGTIPVTADGQPVGLIRDKSGNNNHASQTVAGKRPTYKTLNGDRWLDFDGVDDSLFTASINLSTASKMTVFSGTANYKTTGTGTLIEFSANYMNNTGSFAALTPSLASSNLSFGSRGNGGAGEKETPTAPVGLGTRRVLTCAQDFASTNDYGCDYIRFNQIPLTNLIGSGNSDVGAGPFGTYPAYIGARNNGSNGAGGNSLLGRIYSLVFVGGMYIEETLVAMEEWIDAKLSGAP